MNYNLNKIEATETKANNKTRMSKDKIKELEEQRILEGFENDCIKLNVRTNCGLDIESQNIKHVILYHTVSFL